ncbi:MAG: Stp1/IreP family PP2C-type Ser/Thr phosphatase [Myxococcota bacterium]
MRAEGCSDVGRVRGHNEDYWLADDELRLYVVCDGMGGHAAGEVASRTAAETLVEGLSADRPTTVEEGRARLEAAVHEANRRVYAMGAADKAKAGMGTTCTAVLFVDDRAVLAHVGDSRLYMVRDGEIHQLSSDHTFVAEAVKQGIMTPEQAKRSEHTNVVTRAVGPSPQVLVDTLVFDVLPGDTLLLCSDGLTEYLEDHELRDRLAASGSAAPGLVAVANERGGEDNITVLVVSVDEVDEARATQVQADLMALRHIQLLSELDMAEQAKVVGHLESLYREQGQAILDQGAEGQGLYILVAGEVEVVRDGKVIATLPAGSHFGEMALLNQRPRNATARAMTDCRLLHLSRDGFYQLVQHDHVIGIKFLWRLAQTLSMRLDEAYETPQESEATRKTMRFGLFPSPFAPKR